MVQSIELQVISRILTSTDQEEIDALCEFDTSYYSVFKPQIEFILDHRAKYGQVPDIFTFQAEFANDEENGIDLVQVNESLDYLTSELRKNKQYILFLSMWNKLKDLGPQDVTTAWNYIGSQYDVAMQIGNMHPLNVIKDAEARAQQVLDFSKQTRIPTGFPEIDKLMYGGLSTVEELLVIVARTNTGKSWICVKMMESAQKAGFNVAYYSPEMQGAYLATRFDTWRKHFKNSDLFRGKYTDEYMEYIKSLKEEESDAYIFEDKDMEDGVSPRKIEPFLRRNKIKLLIVDGLDYMLDDKNANNSSDKFKNICADLFNISKKLGCAVVISTQANRETKNDEKNSDKGAPFPSIYNISSSDHIGRIATQVFAVRQIFDKHVLDIRLEKSRNAANVQPIVSYSWDVNNGNMQYIPGTDDDSNTTPAANPTVPSVSILGNVPIPEAIQSSSTSSDMNLDDDNVEF